MLTPLKLELILKGVRQVDIARAAGVGKAYINRVVNGRQRCSAKVIRALREFGIELEGYVQPAGHKAKSRGRRSRA